MAARVLQHPQAKPAKVTEQHIPCDACGSSDAKCVYADGHGYCFSCNTFFPGTVDFMTEGYTYEYLTWRGVDKGTFQFYDTKTKIDGSGKPVSIGYRYPNDSFKVRQLGEKAFHSIGDISKSGLFGRNRFAAGSHKQVIITEGELDALSLYQTVRSPVVSVRSSTSAVMDCTLDRSWLNSFERIYLAFDGDTPGKDAAAGVARLFDFNKVFLVKFPGGERKDANDYVRAGEADELRTIVHNSKKYQPDNIISELSIFKRILSEKPKWGVPYPWPSITQATYGIRMKESVLITALEGVGKTEICHAIEHNILKTTDDNVGAIYIEEPEKRHLEALAGLELRQAVHLPDRTATDSDVSEAIQKVVRHDDRLFIYNHFGSDDPDVILDTIRYLVAARSCKYIILDHISMVVSGLRTSDATKALDYLSTRLQMMLMELDFALILVSHVNDDLLTRGSRNISKIGNVWLHLSRDLKLPSLYTEVSLFKNRYSWKTGPVCQLLFDPSTYTLSEANDNMENLNAFGIARAA